jgi:hypothetical protein
MVWAMLSKRARSEMKVVQNVPSQVLARCMHFHFGRLKLVELFSDCCLILRCESSPRFVCPAIVITRAGHLDVIVESDNLWGKI